MTLKQTHWFVASVGRTHSEFEFRLAGGEILWICEASVYPVTDSGVQKLTDEALHTEKTIQLVYVFPYGC